MGRSSGHLHYYYHYSYPIRGGRKVKRSVRMGDAGCKVDVLDGAGG